jgi:hypothetical protein
MSRRAIEPPACTVRDAAEILNTSERTVHKMLADGLFPNANKLTPGSEKSPWRIPRSDLNPWAGEWVPPVENRPVSVRTMPNDDRPAIGGLSREAMRARAGLPPEPGPSSTYPAADAKSDAPSGTVAVVHPEPARQVVHMTGVYRAPDTHPSEQYLLPDQREERTRTRTAVATVQGRRPGPVATYEGREAAPIDGDVFGAGPAAA